MVWLYRSPIPVGRRGVFYSFKLFLPDFAALRPCGSCTYTTNAIHNKCFQWYKGPCGHCGTGNLGKDDPKAYALCLLILFGSTSYVNIFRMSLKYSSYKILEGSDANQAIGLPKLARNPLASNKNLGLEPTSTLHLKLLYS
jgi:hypothetical protein